MDERITCVVEVISHILWNNVTQFVYNGRCGDGGGKVVVVPFQKRLVVEINILSGRSKDGLRMVVDIHVQMCNKLEWRMFQLDTWGDGYIPCGFVNM